MCLSTPPPVAKAACPVPVDELLDPPAVRRLTRQKQYARVLDRGGGRRAVGGLRDWIAQARNCIQTLSAPPIILLHPVAAVPPARGGGGVRLADRFHLEDLELAEAVAAGAQVTAYLVTMGYSQASAFDWLERDYSAHHVQSDLGNEALFELGRRAHRIQREAAPGARLRRVSVQANDLCGQRKLWDPKKVQELLGVFGPSNPPGVTVTDTGCFQPLNTLLGLTLRS